MSKAPSDHSEKKSVQKKQPDLRRCPARPMLAWMDENYAASAHSVRLRHRMEVNVQILQAGLDGSPLALGKLEEENINVIQAFLRERPKEKDKKLRFLASIPAVCSLDSTVRGIFGLSKLELMKNIKMMLEESLDTTDTMVQQQAMQAIIAMSRADLLFEEKISSVLQVCFLSVFYVPAIEDSQDDLSFILSKTLATMDSMLQELVRNAGSLRLQELQNIFQVLVPFTISEPARVQERAMARIAVLTNFMNTYPPLQDSCCFLQGTDLQHKCSTERRFELLGTLLGHLTLSCTCKDKETSLQAAEALHHLHIFIMQYLRKSPRWHFQEYELEQRPEQSPETAYTERSLTFMKFLQPSQQTDILLLAIKSMSLPKAYLMDMVTRMVDVLLVDSAFQPGHVRKIVNTIYETLHFTTEETLVDSLNSVLLAVMQKHPSKTMDCLLECSPRCNRFAMSMWEVIISSPHDAEKVLLELIGKLLNQSSCKISLKSNPRVTSMAAVMAIRQILLQPNFLQKAKEFFPQLFVALLFQVSFTNELMLEEVNIFWSKRFKDPVSPLRSAVWSMQTLLSHMGFESQVLAIEKQGGWDALHSALTSFTGVRVIAREMKNVPKQLLSNIFCYLAQLLQEEDNNWEMVAMAFLVEIMTSPSLDEELDCVLELVPTYMQSQSVGMQRLVLKVIPKLLSRPSTILYKKKLMCLTQERQALTLLPLIMKKLQEYDSYELSLALLILGNAIELLPKKERSHTALELVEKVQPLFDHESSTVRKLSIRTFQKAMQCVSASEKRKMKKEVWKSLLPLVFHTSDEDERVGKASREALHSIGRFLKWKKLLKVAEDTDMSRINEWLLTKKEEVQHYLQQSKLYLQSQQEPLRLEAVRFLGFLGRKVNEEVFESIIEGLQDAQIDKSPKVHNLVNILTERKSKLCCSLRCLR